MARRCLIIANQHYEDPAFGELPGAAQDATALSEVLARPEIGHFEVSVVQDASSTKIKRSIESFFHDAARDDLLWLHISCHGMKNRDNRLFLAGSDTESGYLASTGVDCTFVSDQVEACRSNKIVVFLDCCYSGAFSRGLRTRGAESVDIAEAFGGRGRVVITASNALQYSHESVLSSRDAAEPSIFTQAIVHGLRSGDADLDLDGSISVDELYEYIYKEVRTRLPNQTPTRSVSSAEGTLVLARNVRDASAQLPAELVRASRSPLSWQRIGVVHELENRLGSRFEVVRTAAADLLAELTRDADPVVAAQARTMWLVRGLGELPVGAQQKDDWGTTYGAVGIDFGTTNSAVAAVVAGESRIVLNEFGNRTTPSIAALTASGEWLVGERAKNQAAANPGRTFSSVKLKLGSGWSAELDGRRYSAEAITAIILRHLKRSAERTLEARLSDVVLTVPAYFTLAERRSLVEAAQQADLNVRRVVTEPNAAALAYGVDDDIDLGEGMINYVLVLDLGGGTFDVSLLDIGFVGPGSPDAEDGLIMMDVHAMSGDSRLGGDNWDQRICEWLCTRFQTAHGIDLTTDASAMRRVREAAERAKIELSGARSTTVTVPYVAAGLTLEEEMSRERFEQISSDLLDRVRRPIERVLKDAGVKITDIKQVLLVGGAARMPAIGALVTELTGASPRRGLIPDGVAIGAAIQAGVLVGEVRDSLLVDAIPWSLGIETGYGVFTKLVERNTNVPTKRSEVFTTPRDNQASVQIRLYQGEHERAADNVCLGTFTLTGLSEGSPQIEITIDIDQNCTVRVTARDVRSGGERSMLVDADSARDIAAADPSARLVIVGG
ncbi:Hsp70 family protein [Lentzea sp. BCCO 10_0856]|uniref:Hsp70 family protein n=1 Tax=Lentzea miocenica TaxID=3095431 RepID=A0ABU4SWA1_9PSEU|nr:Hsp70 family protein [Lentzea sp. BCCO 10_0856]MDX8030185.1 Hsp70 family protein [Lentzea sp. BCCO 10_0856]